MYKCSECGAEFSTPVARCPQCNASFGFIQCTDCGYSGSVKEFADNDYLCPRCNMKSKAAQEHITQLVEELRQDKLAEDARQTRLVQQVKRKAEQKARLARRKELREQRKPAMRIMFTAGVLFVVFLSALINVALLVDSEYTAAAVCGGGEAFWVGVFILAAKKKWARVVAALVVLINLAVVAASIAAS